MSDSVACFVIGHDEGNVKGILWIAKYLNLRCVHVHVCVQREGGGGERERVREREVVKQAS